MNQNELLRTIPDLDLRAPATNIALEESIARSVSSGAAPPTVRFWRNGNAAILGRSQSAGTELNLRQCSDSGLPVIRRPSGGGTVLHHPENLNYSLYLPEPGSGTVREESIRLSRPVADALGEFGIEPRIKPNGLYVGEDKIGGTAESRRWGLLHHGTLLLGNSDLMGSMEDILMAKREDYERLEPKLPSKPSDVTNLDDLSGGRVKLEGLIENLRDRFAARLNLTPVKGRVSEEEWKFASRLAEDKYSSRDWTYRFTGNRNEIKSGK